MKLHKYISVILVFAMILTLTACGKSSGTSSTSSTDYHGEGQVQGGIKSDDEIAALQEEERAGTSDAQPDTTEQQPSSSDATPATSGTGNAEDYWNGNDYFDLENYLLGCGAAVVKIGGWKPDYSGFEERTTNITTYQAFFIGDLHWKVSISAPAEIEFTYTGYQVNGETYLGPKYLIRLESYNTESNVSVNNSGTQIYHDVIDALIYLMDLVRSHPDSDNPFQYNERSDIHIDISNNDIPANAIQL